MNVTERLKNAYSSGGMKEIIRKLYYFGLYKKNGMKIVADVEKRELEYGVLDDDKKREIPVIVSLTTYPKRFGDMELCLKSLILQSVKPDKIIVYLGKDSADISLPYNLEKYKEYGVEFKCDGTCNLKSYKKFYYAMQEFSDAIIITADDDIIYPVNWLESLLESYKKYPHAISARRVHLMRLNGSELAPYNSWIDQCREIREPSHSLFATGCGGILYPPHSLYFRAFDREVFMDICSSADDVWLKCMGFLNDFPVVWVPNNEVDLPEVENTNMTALQNNNVGKNMNDMFMKNVMMKFDINPKMFFE